MSGELVTALAALVTGIGSCLMAYAAIVSTRRKADDTCDERLRFLREESERYADELHALRIRKAANGS